MEGRVVAGRYRLDGEIGRGGMGVVWRATDTLIERTVAIKELRAPSGPGAADGDAGSYAERAMREARHAGRLNHPAVVAVHDVIAPGPDDDAVYIVMEHVEAPSLAEVIDRQGPAGLPAHRVATLGLGILDALDAAHAMGIVHRDVKPGNVLVGDGDRVTLTDFGIALAAEDTRLTRSGVMGTHAYLAPECFDTGQAGPAADLWALGATLFHAVAGRAPFDRDTTTATLRAILFEELPNPPCEPRLAQVIGGLLTRSVDQRLTSAAARQRLAPIAAEPPAPVPAPAPAGGPATWASQATGFHRTPPPSPSPPSPPSPPPPLPPAAPPPQPPSRPQPRPQPRPARSTTTQWILAGAVTAAVAVALVFLAISQGEDGADGPEAAAEQLLEASKNQDLSAAQAILCQEDLSSGFLTDELSSIRVVSYTINEVEQDGDLSIVHATMRTTEETVDDAEIPVIQQSGTWKVCFQSLLSTLDTPSGSVG